MTFNWQFNGQHLQTNATTTVRNVVVPGVGTVSTLMVSNVIPANAGSYSVKVANAGGPVTSSNAVLSVAGGISVGNVTSTNSGNNNSSSLTWSHTIGPGANGLLVVSVSTHSGTAVSSVTCGGETLTRIGYVACPSGSHPSTEMWYLTSPPAGTNNIVVTLNGKDTFTASAESFFGVNQTVPVAGFTAASGAADSPSNLVAAAAGQLVIDSVAVPQATSWTNAGGQSPLWGQETSSSGNNLCGSGSFKAGAAAVPMSWTYSGGGGGEWASGAVALNPASTALSLPGGIALDHVSSANSGGSSSLTWPHSVGTGSNAVLVVGITTEKGTLVSSITCDGVALTRIGYAANPAGSHISAEMWYLTSPPAGTNDIVVTLSGKDTFTAGAESFFGVNQALPIAALTNAAGSADTPGLNLASATNQVVIDMVAAQSMTAGAPGNGQSLLWNQFTGAGGGDVWGSSSVAAGTTNVSMSWTLSGNNGGQWISLAAALNPASSLPAVIGVISVDNTSSANSGSANVTSLTWPHTTGIGINGVLLVNVATHSSAAVSSITYGGVPLTKIGSVSCPSGPHPGAEMWYLKSPAAGTADIVVTLSSQDVLDAGAISLFGVNQTVPFAAFATNTGTAFAPSVSVASATSEAVIDSVAVHQATSGSLGSGQTLFWSQFTGNSGGDVWGSGSIKAGAATTPMSWNLSGSGPGEWAAVAVAINPEPTGVVLNTAAQMTAGAFSCQFSGPTPATYIVLASTNFIDWTPIATNVVLSGALQFTDTAASLLPHRFYQVVAQ